VTRAIVTQALEAGQTPFGQIDEFRILFGDI
jgi:hypothetical protein